MKNVLQATSSTQYQIILVNFLLFQITPTLATLKISFKGTLKTLKNKNYFRPKKIDWHTLFSDCKQEIDLSCKSF